MESKINLIAKKIKYICDECGNGEMKYTGEFNPRNDPPMKHKCEGCQNEVYFRNQYPYIVYEES
jgi:hypothetical protein